MNAVIHEALGNAAAVLSIICPVQTLPYSLKLVSLQKGGLRVASQQPQNLSLQFSLGKIIIFKLISEGSISGPSPKSTLRMVVSMLENPVRGK